MMKHVAMVSSLTLGNEEELHKDMSLTHSVPIGSIKESDVSHSHDVKSIPMVCY